MESIGWIGAIMLAFCGLPQAVECIRKGNANGLNWSFLLMWLGGELFTIAYVFPKSDWPLIFNYSVNIVCISVIVWYKLKPRSIRQTVSFPPIPAV